MSTPPIPNAFIRKIGLEIGESNTKCPGCGLFASNCESTSKRGYDEDECIVFACDACTHRGWIFCKTCQKTFSKSNIINHPTSTRHQNKKTKLTCEDNGTNTTVPLLQSTTEVDSTAVPPAACAVAAKDLNSDHGNDIDDDMNMLMAEDIGDTFHDETSVLGAPTDCGAPPSEMPPSDSEDNVWSEQYPKLTIAGIEWMDKGFEAISRAELQDLNSCFDDMDDMRNFWIAEHATEPKYCGGGLRYLVARTFQNTKGGSSLDSSRMPSYAEARWHIEAFLQYQTMSELQRQRQSRITKSVMGHIAQQKGDFFRHTFIPDYKSLSKMYGKTGKQSIWNTLPIPPVENLNGVSYVSPMHILKYMFANGVPVDNILFDPKHHQYPSSMDVVGHVDECKKFLNWRQKLVEDGAAFSTMTGGVLIWASTYEDGFGPSRTKNNRGSVVAMTITFAPPKNLVNATANTFLVAVGLKRSHGGWEAVANRFKKDMELLSSTDKPTMVYHGVLQKVIPIFFKRFVSIEDKVERPDTTCTIGSGSDVHRCFGVSAKIQTPKCQVEEIKSYLREEQLGVVESVFGWSNEYIDTITGNPNGAKFPACKNCRCRRLQKLEIITRLGVPTVGQCKDCSDWSLLNDVGILDFPKPKDFPAFYYDECPVEPPLGREPNQDALPSIELSFELMKQATRYAFYHASRSNKGNFWTKKATEEYLKTCGIGAKHQAEIYHAAEAARGQDENISYDDEDGIGSFPFPAAWNGELTLRDYIETAMHLLFLGIAESLLDLSTKWLKEGKGKGYSSTNFRRSVQPLLRELKKFQLAWLMAYPFTGTEKDFKTGSWVGENWLAFVRLSPILYGWCCQDMDVGIKNGYHDVARVMLSFHAVCARVLTHQKIDITFIDETEDLMKEFLSCVRELDIRVRYAMLNSGGQNKKKTEAFWLKSNFMSLLNLIDMMKMLGPVILWWDGGGKGERFLQEIKPHIRKGVREDVKDFFRQLHRKMYKVRTLSYFEKRYGLGGGEEEQIIDDDSNDGGELAELEELLDAVELEGGNGGGDDNDDESNSLSADSLSGNDDSSLDSNSNPPKKFNVGDCVSQVENDGMWKIRTIYIYRNQYVLNQAVAQFKPLAGILQSVETGFEFLTVCRKPVKQFARYKLTFSDGEGVQYHGMWYAGIELTEDHVGVTGSQDAIKEEAKMSAVAIPLWYIIGEGKPDSNKYCVITNYWRVRIHNGRYVLPSLDPTLYGGDAPEHQPQPTVVDVVVRDNREFGEL